MQLQSLELQSETSVPGLQSHEHQSETSVPGLQFQKHQSVRWKIASPALNSEAEASFRSHLDNKDYIDHTNSKVVKQCVKTYWLAQRRLTVFRLSPSRENFEAL